MKITQKDISINDFQRAFIDYGRATQFSNEGLDASTASMIVLMSITPSIAASIKKNVTRT